MSLFFLFAVLMMALALLFLLLPLLKAAGGVRASEERLIEMAYRTQFDELKTDLAGGTLDAEQYEISKRELEGRMKDDLAQATAVVVAPASSDNRILIRTALVLGIGVPVAAAALYAWLGTPDAIVMTAANNATTSGAPHGVSDEQIEAMVQKLANQLKDNPNDLQGWYMLARSLATLGRFEDSLKALDQARRLAPNEPQLMADYADVLATTRGGSLKGEPTQLIQKALTIDPNNAKALALAGEVEYRDKNYEKAIEYWTRMKNAFPPGTPPEQVAAVEANINHARANLGEPPLPISTPVSAVPAEAAASTVPTSSSNGADTISGVVTLSPRFANKVNPGDVLFIFAKASNGPPMPLAVLRTSVSDLPKAFVLDDSMAMGAAKLSDYPQVVVSARVSKSGTATPQKGDLTTTVGPVSLGASGLKLVIDSEVQ